MGPQGTTEAHIRAVAGVDALGFGEPSMPLRGTLW
jgi:hypothetical protein